MSRHLQTTITVTAEIDINCVDPWVSKTGNIFSKCPYSQSAIKPVIRVKNEENTPKHRFHHPTEINSSFLKTIPNISNKYPQDRRAMGK